MSVKWESKALKANMNLTKAAHIEIGSSQQAMLDLSSDYWGINNRTEKFFTEFNHPYRDRDFLVAGIRQILLEDIWLYQPHEKYFFFYGSMLDMLEELIATFPEERHRDSLLQTLIEFLGASYATEPLRPDLIRYGIDIIEHLFETDRKIVINSSGYLKTFLKDIAADMVFAERVFRLTIAVQKAALEHWRGCFGCILPGDATDVSTRLFSEKLTELSDYLDRQIELNSAAETWDELCAIPFFSDIASLFRAYSEEFEELLHKFQYIFLLLGMDSMVHMKDYLLWDMNRLLRNLKNSLGSEDMKRFIENIFRLCAKLKKNHINEILDCLLTLGKEVAAYDDLSVIRLFESRLIEFGFVGPGKVTISGEWQFRVEPAHVKNIRTYLELIECAPDKYTKLVPALVVYLKMGSIFISDTDLFQRDITKLLNSDVRPLYKKIKQLTRLFPVYFNRIGAEGKLREYTTAVDELSHRSDRLIHFMRKQIHTESNNTHIALVEDIMRSWHDSDFSALEDRIPDDVMDWLKSGSQEFNLMSQSVKALSSDMDVSVSDILRFGDSDIEKIKAVIPDRNTARKIAYMIKIYALLKNKYSFSDKLSLEEIAKAGPEHEAGRKRLEDAIASGDKSEQVRACYDIMERLNVRIFEDKEYEPIQNIYYKRHIAAGIASMYGEYREKKFDSLGLIFRIEKTVDRLMSEICSEINLDYISAKTLKKILVALDLYNRGISIDGIQNRGLESNIGMIRYCLKSSSFSIEQYLNIFSFIQQNIKEIISEYFIRVYDSVLRVIIPQYLKDAGDTASYHKEAERFYRDIISFAFLLQSFDGFVSGVVQSLQNMQSRYSPEFNMKVLSYDPDMVVSPLYEENSVSDNRVYLGAKAFFIKQIHALGFPTPEGFVLTTELFRYRQTVLRHPQMLKEIENMIKGMVKTLEKRTGRKFGSSNDPLLLSVRSGTAISLPGAMSTFLNVGMSKKLAEAVSRSGRHPWTAWDSYRRLIQCWGMSEGIERNEFDRVIAAFKEKHNVSRKADLLPLQMQKLAELYGEVLAAHDVAMPEDPHEQLMHAIRKVLDSWDSKRALIYRDQLSIASEWGTAVTIQQMVFGNLDDSSGTGVLFTHNPYSGKSGVELYGDFTIRNQGEDIVSGLVNVLPVTEKQRHFSGGDVSLEKDFPLIFLRLKEIADELTERRGYAHQEIEFTFESADPSDLYILQIRQQVIKQTAERKAFDAPESGMKLVGKGVGIGNSVINGIVVFSKEDISRIRKTDTESDLILVRPDTVPDDIDLILECQGLLTARGGACSHASVTASRLGKVCVVNCMELNVREDEGICSFDSLVMKSGDKIALDAFKGHVYSEHYGVKSISY